MGEMGLLISVGIEKGTLHMATGTVIFHPDIPSRFPGGMQASPASSETQLSGLHGLSLCVLESYVTVNCRLLFLCCVLKAVMSRWV